MTGPRFLYLHGFASGPDSHKARAVAAHYEARGVEVGRLDLRQPSMTHLRLSKMIEHVRGSIGGARDRAVVFGSSLGGLTACRAAEEDARIAALVLLAPAFRMIERWRVRIGEEAWAEWQRSGWLETIDYAKGGMAKVDFGFAEDVGLVDGAGEGWPDVRVPVLIVHGAKDDVVSVDLSRDFARGKRHVRLVEVDDGHELAASLPTILAEADAFMAPFLGSRDT
jgi:pimeloyl-ACP methyl ester carboxylesterase